MTETFEKDNPKRPETSETNKSLADIDLRDNPAKSKFEQAKLKVKEIENKIEEEQKEYYKQVGKLKEITKTVDLEKDTLNQKVLPKVKSIFAKLKESIKINEIDVLDKDTNIENKIGNIPSPPNKPYMTKGKFSGFILGLFIGLATTGLIVLQASKKAGITIPQNKLMTQEESHQILATIGNYLNIPNLPSETLGSLVLLLTLLLTFLTIYFLRKWTRTSKSIRNVKNYEKDAEEYIEDIKTKKEDVIGYALFQRKFLKELELLRVLINEKITNIEKMNMIKKHKVLSDMLIANNDMITKTELKEIYELINKSNKIINKELIEEEEIKKAYNDLIDLSLSIENQIKNK